MASSKLRILFLGNQNNNHFAVVRYLRDRGYDVHLALTDAEQAHFDPSCDTFDLDYMRYTRQLGWGSERSFAGTPSDRVRRDLEGFDVFVGTGLIPAYLARAGVMLDVFDPYGEDIWGNTRYRLANPRYLRSHLGSVHWQRRGIGRARNLHAGKMAQHFETQMDRYGRTCERWYEKTPMVYAPQYDFSPRSPMLDRTHWAHEFRRIRDRSDLMVVFPARNNFSSPGNRDINTKGIDTFLEGFRAFCDRAPEVRATAVFFQYGNHVAQARQLARDLGLGERAVWFPQMFRKDLMVGLGMADVCCGQFGLSWVQSGAIFEGMVAGKPILTWRDERYYADEPDLYPIYNANSAEEIAARLESHVADPEAGRRMGAEGRDWYERMVVEKPLAQYESYFARRAQELGKEPR